MKMQDDLRITIIFPDDRDVLRALLNMNNAAGFPAQILGHSSAEISKQPSGCRSG